LVPLSLGAAFAEAGLEVLARSDPLADGTASRHLNDEVPPYHRDNDGFPVAAAEHTAQQLLRNHSNA
jgi:hypothetical protein